MLAKHITSAARQQTRLARLSSRSTTWYHQRHGCSAEHFGRLFICFSSTASVRYLTRKSAPDGPPFVSKTSIRDRPAGSQRARKQRSLHDHLDFEVRYSPVPQASWKHFLEPATGLAPHLQDDRLSVLRTETDDLNLVQRCLEHHVALLQRSTETKDEERSQYRATKPGTRTLAWFVDINGIDRFDLVLAPSFVRVLTFCLAAEDEGSSLWTWLSQDHTPEFATSWLRRDQIAWRGAVLRYFLEGIVYWSKDSQSGLDGALSAYRYSLVLCKKRFKVRSEAPFIPPYPAAIYLLKWLKTNGAPSMSRSAVQQFSHSLNVWMADRSERQFNQALLLLNPGVADPTEAFDFLKASATGATRSRFVDDLLNPRERRTEQTLFHFIIRTAKAFKSSGRLQDAIWTLEFGFQCAPDSFAWRGAPMPEPDAANPPSRLTQFTTDRSPTQIRLGDGGSTDRSKRVDSVLIKMDKQDRDHRRRLREEAHQRHMNSRLLPAVGTKRK